jgi:hypothetical protein
MQFFAVQAPYRVAMESVLALCASDGSWRLSQACLSFLFPSSVLHVAFEPPGGMAQGGGIAASLTLGRGKETSSARPRGATIASLRLRTREASGSGSLSWMACSAPKWAAFFHAGRKVQLDRWPGGQQRCRSQVAAPLPGNATGSTWLPNSRRRSCST